MSTKIYIKTRRNIFIYPINRSRIMNKVLTMINGTIHAARKPDSIAYIACNELSSTS